MTIISKQLSTISSLSTALLFAVLLCYLSLLSSDVSAAQLYRYKDDQGNYVLNHTIPPKYVKKGYDILNRQGRVIRTVAPELTSEQIAARDKAKEEERLRELEAKKQAIADNKLKQLYSHPNEAVRVLSRRTQDILALIQVKRNRIESSKNAILEEEALAATRQRQGLSILESTLKAIDKAKSDISINEHDISELQNELEKVKTEYDEKIRRLEVLTGQEASDYKVFLESLKSPGKDSNASSEANPS